MAFPDDVPVLSDGTVSLRAHHRGDLDSIVEQCTDPLSIEWTTVPVPYTLAHAAEWVDQRIPKAWSDGSDLCFAIETEGRFAGSTSLRPEGDGVAEIAYGLAAWARGRGVMTRAGKLLLDWGFEQRGCAVVIWRANVGNWASRRVAWSLGFSFDGTVRELLLQRERRYDGWVGSLRPDDPREPTSRWLTTPVLETERLRLRPWQEGDVDRIVEACSDPVVRHWQPNLPAPYTESSAQAFMLRTAEQAAAGSGIGCCIADTETDRVLGSASVFDIGRRDPSCAEIGYWSHPDARGAGVVTAAVGRLAEHCFGDPAAGGLGLRRLFLTTAAGNAASCRVAERVGFSRVGTERRAYRLADGHDDTAVYDLLGTDLSHPSR